MWPNTGSVVGEAPTNERSCAGPQTFFAVYGCPQYARDYHSSVPGRSGHSSFRHNTLSAFILVLVAWAGEQKNPKSIRPNPKFFPYPALPLYSECRVHFFCCFIIIRFQSFHLPFQPQTPYKKFIDVPFLHFLIGKYNCDYCSWDLSWWCHDYTLTISTLSNFYFHCITIHWVYVPAFPFFMVFFIKN